MFLEQKLVPIGAADERKTMQQNLEQLKCSSVRLDDKVAILWPRGKEPKELRVPKILGKFANSLVYSINNGRLAFVEGESYYVTKHLPETIHILEKAGYKRTTNLYVPLSNGEVPADTTLRKKWESIIG